MKATLAALLVAVPAAGCAPAAGFEDVATGDPGLRLRERTVLYDVDGATAADLARSLDARGPRIDGERFRGATRWSLKWSYRYGPGGAECAPEDVVVLLDVTTTLPRWRRPADVDPALVDLWREWRGGLVDHEAGHRAMALEAAAEVLRALRGERAASCDELPEAVDAAGRAIVSRYRELHRRYDEATAHGVAPGAAGWPAGVD